MCPSVLASKNLHGASEHCKANIRGSCKHSYQQKYVDVGVNRQLIEDAPTKVVNKHRGALD